jgi:hypothetical protein
MVPADSPAKTAKDLNGKIIAVNGLKNITQLATEAQSDIAVGRMRRMLREEAERQLAARAEHPELTASSSLR